MKGENINILKKSIRQRRAISSCLYENGSYNYSEEEKNKSKNSMKSFHRKTTSSYFCGSYLSSNLEDDLINNINIDQYLEKNKKEEKKEKENILLLNKDNNLDIFDNLSFHSFDSDNNKIEEEDLKKKKKKEIEKENKKNNNFVTFKNNLKNIKDKNERVTKSYLLALGMTKYQDRKEEYIPTVSVIEEEKSDVIDSKSEFSNKKKKINDNYFLVNSFLNKDNMLFLRKENKLKIKSILEKKNNCELKNKIKEENKNNTPKKKENQVIKLSCALNEIIIKNNIKEENKRKHLKKNKTLILNSFFNNEIKNTNEIINKKMNIESERKKNVFKNTENVGDNLIEKFKNKMGKQFQLFIKEKIRNSYASNFIKRRYNTENNVNKDKKSFKNKILRNKEKDKNNQTNKMDNNSKTYKYNNNFESTINSNLDINNNNYTIKKNENQVNYKFKSNIPIITRIEYRPWSKIPHLRQKIIERKEINSVSNINTNNSNNTNNNNNNTSNKNSAPNRKYISKYKNIPYKKNYSFTKEKRENKKDNKDNSKSMKQIKSINEALEIIRIERIKSKNKEKSSLKILNESNNSKKKHNKSSSSISKNVNSKSSRDKEKNNKITIKKANSGTFRNDITLKLIDEKTIKYPGNKKSTINVLNKYLKYEKKYNKINVLNQIEKTFDSEKSFFVIICEKITVFKNETSIQNKDIFIFKSILKFYRKQNRFIKIYGNENEPNVISIKNINTNKYNIYVVNMKNELFCLVPINELIFDFNAIILCKK